MNYVKCRRCEEWDSQTRVKNLCSRCNNSGLVQDPKEIVCNMCGNGLCPNGDLGQQIPFGLYNARVSGGFDSYHLFDLSTYTFSFCEECLRKLFIQCKVSVAVLNADDFEDEDPTSWETDLEYYNYRVWKDTGGHHQAYMDGKCNLIKDCPNKAVYTQLSYTKFTEECRCEEHKDKSTYLELVPFISHNLRPFL